MVVQLLNNVTLLVTLIVGMQVLSRHLSGQALPYKILSGIIFGLVSIISMLTPIAFETGVILDARSIVISLAGMFCGPLAASIAAIISGAFRIYLGGAGVPLGLSLILMGYTLGVVLYYLRQKDEKWIKPFWLILFNAILYFLMIAQSYFLPIEAGIFVRELAPVIMVLYPLGFLVLAQVFLEGEKRIQAELALEESEQSYKNLFEEHAAVKLIIDPKTGKIVDANHAASAYYGWQRDELQQMFIHDINTLSSEEVEREMEKVINQEKIFYEFKHRHADGSIHDVKVFSSIVFLRGKEYLHSIVHDCTKEKVLEKQLLQAQKMEAVGHLAGGIAHDFNNILQTMMGYSQLLLRDFQGNEVKRGYLQLVCESSERAAKLTRQLLTFSRQQVAQPKIINLNLVVENFLTMLERVIGEHIELEWIPEKKLISVFADAGMIEQVLLNLCLNARDAMPVGGKLTIVTSNVKLDSAYCETHIWATPGQYVLLSISDTGCGMNKETLDRLFEPFFTTKEPGKGTGLGLATVYGIMKQHDGFINVYSEPGNGTLFNAYIPAKVEESEPQVKVIDTEDEYVNGTETILLAEDNEMVQTLAVRILESAGYTILVAGDGEEAISIFNENRDKIDLLLFDVVMPKMNGHIAYAEIKKIATDIPVILSSGYSESAINSNFTVHQEINLLQKPYTPKALLKAVRNAIDNPVDTGEHLQNN